MLGNSSKENEANGTARKIMSNPEELLDTTRLVKELVNTCYYNEGLLLI